MKRPNALAKLKQQVAAAEKSAKTKAQENALRARLKELKGKK